MFEPCKGDKGIEEPVTALIIEEVANMTLGSEVEEFKRERNMVMLASWGVLTREEDELNTVTSWADFEFGYNFEPFRTEVVKTWVTLPGGAASEWVNDAKMDMNRALNSMDVWKDAGLKPLPKYIRNRNFKGLDLLLVTHGDLRRIRRSQMVPSS
jgi:hypothetical protein